MPAVDIPRDLDRPISDVARRMGRTKAEIIRLLYEASKGNEVVDMSKDSRNEFSKIASSGGDWFDKLMQMFSIKMMGSMMGPGTEAKSGMDLDKLIGFAVLPGIMRGMSAPQGMDPTMLMLLMKNDSGDSFKNVIELQKLQNEVGTAQTDKLVSALEGKSTDKFDEKINGLETRMTDLFNVIAAQGQAPQGSYEDRTSVAEHRELKSNLIESGEVAPAGPPTGQAPTEEFSRWSQEHSAESAKQTEVMQKADKHLENAISRIDNKADTIMGMVVEQQRAQLQAASPGLAQPGARPPGVRAANYQQMTNAVPPQQQPGAQPPPPAANEVPPGNTGPHQQAVPMLKMTTEVSPELEQAAPPKVPLESIE